MARRAVYDRARGRLADGIDGGRVHPRSKAEANAVGAQALLEEIVAVRWRATDVLPGAGVESAAAD